MKMVLITAVLLVVLGCALLFLLGVMSRSGSPPGLQSGRLAPCPDKPNCVCSEYASPEPAVVDSIPLQTLEATRAWPLFKRIISQLGGKISREEDDYFAATFQSRLFGFVDDVEARLDLQQGVIHLRSASRAGHSDFGVNRQRVALIRAAFVDAIPGEGLQTKQVQAGNNE